MRDEDVPVLGWIQPRPLRSYRDSRSVVWLVAGPVVVERKPRMMLGQWVALSRSGDLIVADGDRERFLPLRKGSTGTRVGDAIECVERSGSPLRIRGVTEADLVTILPHAFHEVSSAHPATAAAEAFGWPVR